LAHSNVNVKYKRSGIVPEIDCLSVHKIIGKEGNDMVVEPCFLQDEREESIIQ